MKMTTDELARDLDLTVDTINRWVRQGRIPIRRTGDICHFTYKTLKKWADEHHLDFNLMPETPVPQIEGPPITLSEALRQGGIHYNLVARDAQTALQAAVDHLEDLSPDEKTALFERLWEREELMSTGIGRGIAIPHPRSPIATASRTAFIAAFFLEKSIPFAAIDDQPVFVMFLLVFPDIKQHLHFLSRLSFCLRNDAFISFLKGRPEPAALLQQIADLEHRLDQS